MEREPIHVPPSEAERGRGVKRKVWSLDIRMYNGCDSRQQRRVQWSRQAKIYGFCLSFPPSPSSENLDDAPHRLRFSS